MATSRITITFKQAEMEMLEFLQTKSSPAAYIKDLVKKEMDVSTSASKTETTATHEVIPDKVQAAEKPTVESPKIIDDIDII